MSSHPETPTSFAAGRYRVHRLLGEGGRKRVYLAHDIRLDRDVAFALIKTEGLDEAGRTRLQHEAQAMGRLGTHPHLVTVFDVGEEGGQPYLVSEHMAGGALDAVLQAAPDHRLPVADVLRLAMEICRGLEHAHAGGVLHRDVKPANVWLTASGTAKLGDFGLALARDRSRLTVEGMMVGTVAYMAPEQALGRPLDARSDLYALGALLYELVTGAPPFTGEGAVAVVSQHLHTAPVAPSWHAPGVPPALDALILQLLAKTPAERPPSAAAVREALAAIAAADAAPARAAATAAPNPLEGLGGGGFVGRAREMDTLRSHLEEAVSGQGRLVLLAGEPGIGKTRTAEELATYARLRGAAVLWGRCHEGEGAPAYWPWVQVIRAHARERDAATLREELGPGADDVAQLVSEIRTRFPDVPPPPALEPAAARFRLFDSMTTFVKNIATRQPLLLILDDLHWADTPSLLLLEFLARELAAARVLVLGTYRDTEVGPEHPLFKTLGALAREPVTRRLALRGFDAGDLTRYLETTTGAAPSAALVEEVLRETDGNPFFVAEVVRLLVAEGGIERLRRGATGHQPIPEQVREVIGRRLGHLSPECNQVLQHASVIGREVELNLLARASEVPRDRLLAAIEEAAAARILVAVPGTLAGYRFAHALVRETLYEALPITRRATLHQRAGEAIEDLYGADAKPHLAALAHHFFEAARPGGDVAKAIAASRRAGERSDELLAFEDAARHYERALQALDRGPERGDDRQRLALLRALGVACTKADVRPDQKMAPLERAVELAERIGDPNLQAATALEYHAAVNIGPLVDTGAQVPALERALAALGPADSVLAALLLAALVSAHPRGAAGERIAQARAARAMAERVGDVEARCAALGALHSALLGPAGTEERLAITAERLDVSERLGAGPVAVINALHGRVLDLCEIGDMVGLDAAMERAFSLIDRMRDFRWQGLRPLWRGMRAAFEGRFEEAERCALEQLQFAGRTGHAWYEGAAWGLWIEIRRAQGRLAEIDGVLGTPLSGSPADRAQGQALRARHELEMGREENGRAWFEPLAADDFRAIEMGWHFLPTMLLASTVAHRLQDRPRAAILYDRLRPYGARNIVSGYAVQCFGSASMPLALLAATLGRFDDAARHFEDAIAFDRKTGARPWLARAQYEYAVMLEARGRPEDVGTLHRLVSEALRTFDELGMKQDVERALALQLRTQGLDSADVTTSIDAVATAVEQERPDLRPHAAPDGTVTLLFTDIEGSTAMTERLGDRRAQALLRAHNALVREQVAAHGGFEVKSQGDGFMVAFASARRAVRCAIAIQRALAGHGARHPEEPIRVRIGLHTGEAIRESGDFFGTNVNLAARIAAAARGGEILVSSVLKELVESAGDVPFGHGRRMELRGLAGPRTVFAVTWAGESAAPEAPSGNAVFRLEGDYWTIAHDGVVCRLRDTTGLRYLAHLLRHPGREFHALEVLRAGAGHGVAAAGPPAQGAAGPVLDQQAKAAYRARLADLRAELEEAEEFNDPGRAARAREEIERLTEQLAAGVGLGGRDRVLGADAERARSAVTHAIKAALKRITHRVPSLGHALAPCIRTGTFCAYTPDPSRPLGWEL